MASNSNHDQLTISNIITADVQAEVEKPEDILTADVQDEVEKPEDILTADVQAEVEKPEDILTADVQAEVETPEDILTADVQAEVEKPEDILTADVQAEVEKPEDILTAKQVGSEHSESKPADGHENDRDSSSNTTLKIEMKEPTDVDLLLIGKTGNGKSATGNSILRRRAFKSRSSTTSVTLDVADEVSEFNGRVLKVVDGPGVGDTRMNTENAVNMVLEKMEFAIAANPRGYHAFLLVVRFGGRFTAEDQDTIAFLKKIFGADFVKNYCILLLTCGDMCEQVLEETGQTFQEWCDEQEGVFKELLNECDNRIILFNNTTKDDDIKSKQVSRLLEMVDNLSCQKKRYTDENFKKAQVTRDEIIITAQIPVIKEETMKETSLIMQKLEEIQKQEDPEKKIQPMQQLLLRAQKLLDDITARDRGTGALHELCSTVNSIKKSVDDEVKFCYRMRDERQKIKKREEESRRMYEEIIRKQNIEYKKRFKDEQRVLEDRKEYEKEQERLRLEMVAQHKKEKEELESNFTKKLNAERVREETKYEDMYNELKKIKAENDKSIFSKVVSTVAWPFRKVKAFFS